MPAGGLIPDYLEFCTRAGDAPALFHLGAGLALMGHVLAPHVWLPHGARHLFPNLYVGLVSAGPYLRPATALHLARELVPGAGAAAVATVWGTGTLDAWFDALADEPLPQLRPAPPTVSRPPEGLTFGTTGAGTFAGIGSEPAKVVCSSPPVPGGDRRPAAALGIVGDLPTWLRRLNLSCRGQGCAALTDWYDVPPWWTGPRQTGGRVDLSWPCPSLLGSCTADWLVRQGRRAGPRDFWARWLFFPAAAKARTLALPPPPDEGLRQAVARGLEALSEVRGEMNLAAEAGARYAAWLERFEQQTRPDDDEPWGADWGTAALKVAMIYEAATSGRREISEAAMGPALDLVDHLHRTLGPLLASFGRGRWGEDYRRVCREIRDSGAEGVPHYVLLRWLSPLPAGRLGAIVRTLEESDQISIHKEGLVTWYRWK
jgi:hypothetical protein